jgi:hypothetical protein
LGCHVTMISTNIITLSSFNSSGAFFGEELFIFMESCAQVNLGMLKKERINPC